MKFFVHFESGLKSLQKPLFHVYGNILYPILRKTLHNQIISKYKTSLKLVGDGCYCLG